MIIRTTNEELAALLTGYGQRFDDCFRLYPLPAKQLGRLTDVLTTKYAGQWSVDFDFQPATSYEDLTAGLDGKNWQTFMSAPSKYGGDTSHLVNFIENVYGLPVDNSNHEQVAQMFRLWYASTFPNEYVNPPTTRPAKYAELNLLHPSDNASRSKRQRQRLAQTANRLGFDTIALLSQAVSALPDEDAAKIAAILQKT